MKCQVCFEWKRVVGCYRGQFFLFPVDDRIKTQVSVLTFSFFFTSALFVYVHLVVVIILVFEVTYIQVFLQVHYTTWLNVPQTHI